MRLALGGSHWRLARLLFTESLLVAVAGAALGLVFATWSSALLVRQLSTWRDAVSLDLPLDWRVLSFTALVASLASIVAGVAPVVGLKSVGAGEALKDGGRSVAGDRRFAVRGALVVAQIAVSLVLVVAAGLCVRTLASLNRLPLGFVPEPLVVVDLNLRAGGAPIETRGERVERMLEAARMVPGVRSASLSAVTLLTGGGWGANRIAIDEQPLPVEDSSRNRLWRNGVAPGWFQTMGLQLLSGRDFNDGDRVGSPSVAIVNEAFVRRYRVGPQPIGRTIRVGTARGEDRFEIVGLVGDAVYTSPRDGMLATLYVPMAQREPGSFWATVLLTVNAVPGQRAAVERELAAALARTDPGVAFTFRTFDQFVDATVTQERLIAMLSGFFGGLALLLAAIGLYGVVSQAVRTRQREIGLRLALGAEPAGILRLVFFRVTVLIAGGLALGLGVSWWAAKFAAPLLFQIEARDPATFAGATAVLVAAGLLAAWLPARRAARLDPATVLRQE